MSSPRALSDNAKEKLAELRELSDKAETGDKEARKELRKILKTSAIEVIDEASNFARDGQRIVAETISAGEPLMQEAVMVRLDHMRREIAGESPTPLEVLLTERIVSVWLLSEALDMLASAQLSTREGASKHRSPLSYMKFIFKWQEQIHRRYLSSIRELARVRKLQSNTPGIQANTQINYYS